MKKFNIVVVTVSILSLVVLGQISLSSPAYAAACPMTFDIPSSSTTCEFASGVVGFTALVLGVAMALLFRKRKLLN